MKFGEALEAVYHFCARLATTCTIRHCIFSEKHFLKKISGCPILNLMLS